jgi:predicted DNA-binding transcriptional regulator AlpA
VGDHRTHPVPAHALMADRPLPDWPRGMSEYLAASYVGLGVSTFRREWSADRAPRPVQLTPGRQVWLREDLDAYLDRLAGWTASNRGQPAVMTPEAEWDVACNESDATFATHWQTKTAPARKGLRIEGRNVR